MPECATTKKEKCNCEQLMAPCMLNIMVQLYGNIRDMSGLKQHIIYHNDVGQSISIYIDYD